MPEQTIESPLQIIPEIRPNIPTKKPFMKAVLVVAMVLLLGGAVYAGMKIQEKKNNPTPSSKITPSQNIPTAVPTTDPTVGWKTYNNKIFSFKYPQNLTLEERQTNFFVLLTDSSNPQSVLISIDARQTGDFANYENAITSTKANLIEVQSQDLDNGIKIFGKIGPGMGQGQPIVNALFKYQQGAVAVETTATDSTQLQLFDQILSTFKFTE